MKITFNNFTVSTVYIAIMRYNTDSCGDYGSWETKGWFRANPFKSVHFYTDNRYSTFYAKSADGSEWSGGYGPICVWHHAFSGCVNLCDTQSYDRVGMRLIDGDKARTINLVY